MTTTHQVYSGKIRAGAPLSSEEIEDLEEEGGSTPPPPSDQLGFFG